MLAAVPSSPLALFGQLALLIALVCSCYSAGIAIAGVRTGRSAWVASGINALYLTAALVALSCITLWYAILTHDFTIRYVAAYSDRTMSTFYLITALWGGLDGSILFWVLLLTVFSAIAVAVNRRQHRELIGYVVAILMIIATFFLLLIVFWGKNPFNTHLLTAPANGKGLNPLLQTYWMAIHPPSLYLGYVGMSVPYAFCMAALFSGRLDDAWLSAVRRWVLFAWFFLSFGLVLGSIWAYEELGWGGIWAWDPVENAGFFPWLTATAFLHSVMIQERRGMFRVWNVSLMVGTFFLTIFGTFMTRSGIVQSVHAFGQDNELAYLFLLFMFGLAVISFGLVFFRLPELRSGGQFESWLSREFMFLVNNWILLSATFFVLFATMFPTMAEFVTGERIIVKQEFFNRWMVPLGIVLVALTGVGPLIAWKRATSKQLYEQFMWPLLTGALAVGLIAMIWPGSAATSQIFSSKIYFPAALCCFFFCAFTFGTIAQEFIRGALIRKKQTRGDFFGSLLGLVLRNRRRYGGYMIHLGIVVIFIGFAGHAYHHKIDRTLKSGESVKFSGYEFMLEKNYGVSEPGYERAIAQVAIFEGGDRVRTLHPEKRVYSNDEATETTEASIWRQLDEDVYIILRSASGSQANLTIHVNPLINWVWIGFALLSIWTFFVMLPDGAFAFLTARTESGAKMPLSQRSATLLITVGGAAILLWGSHRVFAEDLPPGVTATTTAESAPAPVAPGIAPGEAPIAPTSAPDIASPSGASAPVTSRAGKFAHSDLAPAEEDEPQNALEKSLFTDIVCMCGGCGRQNLKECRCPYARNERNLIRGMLAQGADYEKVVESFVARYGGQQVLAAPGGGLGVWNWLVPAVVIASALLFLTAFALRIRRRRLAEAATVSPAGVAAAAPVLSDEDEERVDDELERID